jgi:hypothetical protein
MRLVSVNRLNNPMWIANQGQIYYFPEAIPHCYA